MSFDFSTLITDRSQSDLSYLKSLLSKPMIQWTDAEKEQFNRAASKAAYNHTDLNRVTDAMTYLDSVLLQKGYKSGFEPIRVHSESEPTLPDGYTELQYIESSGAQYIDAGFKPDQDTRVVMDFELLQIVGQYADPIFGVRTSASSGAYYFWCPGYNDSTERYQSGYNASSTYPAVTRLGRHTVDKNKNVTTVDGVTTQTEYSAFTTNWNMLLFNSYNNGNLYGQTTKMRLYSCTIHNNEVLIRDYIPCVDPGGNIGLYDKVSGRFYGNAGTGAFIAGPSALKPGYDPNTLLLLHGESVEDSSGYSVPITNSGVQVSDAQSKFGGKSLYFDGGSQIQFPQYEFSDQDFTIDWWEYCEDGAGDRFSLAYTVEQDKYGGLYLGYKGAGVSCSTQLNNVFDMIDQAMFDVVPGQWVHRAFVRHGNTFASYKNGVLFSSVVASGKIAYDPTYKSSIGDHRLYDHSYFIGYIDEYRISNVARWTSDFTPPAEPYEVEISTEEPLDPYTWYESDTPTLSQMEQYLKNVVSICNVFFTPNVPKKIIKFTQGGANSIESALLELKNFIDRLNLTPVPCGVATCGGDYL